ncbi:MAG: FAD-dependent oxidoreductase [Lachnospiraceae bacterium]|nr:FAD-dependent oxidoreductase [Lachnospiraceae bacterium]
MDNKYAKLYEPIQLGNVTLKNRFIMAPMSTCDNLGFHMTDTMIRFVEERAKGGVAMIMTECQAVDKIDSMTSNYKTAGTPNQEKEWKNFNQRVKRHGVKTCVQLGAGAGQNTVVPPFVKALSASELPLYFKPNKHTTAMTVKQIHELVATFGKVAASAKRAGFDAVEIHAHTGYMLDQFISACWNHRTDEYGGSVENRARIVVEIIEEIRKNVGPEYPIILRVSMDHKMPNQRTPEESMELIKVIDKTSLTAYDVDLGCYGSGAWGVTPDYYGDAAFLPAARTIRKVTDKPVMCAGAHTPDTALEAVEKGEIDYVMIGRQLIADPQFLNKVQEGRMEDVRPCLRCNNYCICHFFKLLPLSCAVNPAAADEEMMNIPRTAKPQNVVVIGGGPGGMEAAILAANAGHRVTLYDKADKLGGQMNVASTPPFKGQMKKLLAYLEREVEKSGAEVVLNAAITPDSPELSKADQIVVALGADPIFPKIPGIDRNHVIEVQEAHTSRAQDIKGEKIVVLGGGFSGCEMALELAQEGKQVTLVEMTDKLAAKANPENGTALRLLLNQYKVVQRLKTKVVSFVDDGVVVETNDGRQETIPADTAIVAFGTRPQSAAAQAIKERYPQAVIVGDCTGEVGLVGDAIHDAYEAVWLFDGDISKKKKYLKKRKSQEKFKLMLSSYIMPHK